MAGEVVGVLCKEIPHSEKAGSHSVWISTLGSGKEKERQLAPERTPTSLDLTSKCKIDAFVQMKKIILSGSSVFSGWRHQYSALTSVNLCSLCSPENIWWYSISGLFWASLAALYATAIQWLYWIKPTMALLEEGCNFLVICMLRWCTGYEGTYRGSISLYVMHSLFERKKLQAGFPWSKSSTRVEHRLYFHRVAENKCMFTVTVNLQTCEGKWLLGQGKVYGMRR